MSCQHNDCLTCPYPDCISETGPGVRPMGKKKPGRKKMDAKVVHQHRLNYQRKYYKEHPEQYREYYRKYTHEKTLNKPLTGRYIWVTDGKTNKAIPPKDYSTWQEKGWWRGRTVNWRKDNGSKNFSN